MPASISSVWHWWNIKSVTTMDDFKRGYDKHVGLNFKPRNIHFYLDDDDRGIIQKIRMKTNAQVTMRPMLQRARRRWKKRLRKGNYHRCWSQRYLTGTSSGETACVQRTKRRKCWSGWPSHRYLSSQRWGSLCFDLWWGRSGRWAFRQYFERYFPNRHFLNRRFPNTKRLFLNPTVSQSDNLPT